jgi:D-glycero-D-manno-heptose 1,7-bisphosphate phosphatase
VFHCPYHPSHGIGKYKVESFDRKPNPGMLLRAADLYTIDLENSIMVGDKDTDMQAAKNAGVGVRCHFLSNPDFDSASSASTNSIHLLQECIPLLTRSE